MGTFCFFRTGSAALTLFASGFIFMGGVRGPSSHPQPNTVVSADDCLWKIDLTSTGFTPLEYPQADDQSPDAGDMRRSAASYRIGYLDANTVLVSYNSRPASNPEQTPYTLHAIVVDARNGNILRQQKWPATIAQALVFVRGDGGFIVFDGDQVIAYDLMGNLLKKFPLAGPQKGVRDLGELSISDSGHTMLVQFHADSRTDCEWINTIAMSERVGPCELPQAVFISDERLATFNVDEKHGFTTTVAATKPGEQWHNVCDSHELSVCTFVRFVHGHILVNSAASFALFDDSDRVQFRKDFEEGLLLADVTGSEDSDRFAAAIYPSVAKKHAHYIAPQGVAHIYAFEPKREKTLCEIETPYSTGSRARIALSPDGRQAAILNGSFVREYILPAFDPSPE